MKSFSDYIVNLGVLRSNAQNIKNLIGDTKFCAIVKANAYGLGLEPVCHSLYGIADYFGVANFMEAIKIRTFDKTTNVLILGVTPIEDLTFCAGSHISVSVSDIVELTKISDYCEKNKVSINIHIQINTGLNRFGFRSIIDFKRALKLIDKSKYVTLQGCYSHFATKSQDIPFIKRQYMRFMQFKKYVKDENVVFHIANSYATILDSKFRLDMVRNGFLLYGGTENNIGNRFVLSIKSKIVNIMNVKKGDTIGYDRTFTVKKSMKIAVIPLGYADGLDRKLSNLFYVLIGGIMCRIVGLICMDVFMVDITSVEAKLLDEVVILGSQKGNEIKIADMADCINASPYEILLKLNPKRMNYIIKN